MRSLGLQPGIVLNPATPVDQVHDPEVGEDLMHRGRRVQHDPRVQVQLAHPADRRGGVAQLDVDRAPVGPGLGHGLQEGQRVLDHQVAVQEQVRVLAERRDHRRADRQVRDEMPVHHVDVEEVGLGADPFDLGRQHRVVGRQDRRGDADRPGAHRP